MNWNIDPASRRWVAGIITIVGVASLGDRASDPRPSNSWWTGLAFLVMAGLLVTPEGTRAQLALRVAGVVFAILSLWHLASYHLS